MKEHYEAVLKDMDEKERKLEAQLEKIRSSRPGILALMEESEPKQMPGPSLFAPPKYAAMGLREAVLDLLAGHSNPVQTSEIENELRGGGVKSNSNDFPSVVKSTLANLKKLEKVVRKEDGWVLPRVSVSVSSSWNPNAQQQPLRQ